MASANLPEGCILLIGVYMKKTTRKAPAKRTARRKARRPAARRPAVRPAAAKPVRETRKARLQHLLFDSISHMDEEGLVFLLRQAHILSSNANTARINQEIEAFEREQGPRPKVEEAPQGTASIEAAPDGKSYFLVIGTARKALTRAELGGIVGVCLGAASREVGVRNLFRALGRERGDILVDAKISGPTNPHLGALYDKVLEMARSS
jgi:hypothetical protein